MIYVSGICQYFSEICIYLATLRFAFVFFADVQAPLPVAAIFCAAGVAAAFFSRLKGFASYLPMFLTLPAFFLGGNIGSIITLIPLEMLLYMHIKQKSWKGDSVILRSMLAPGALVFCFMLLAASLGDRIADFKEQALPFFTCFLGLIILSLRVIRNEDVGRTDAKFYFLNLGLVCLVGAGGFLFSSKWLLGGVKAVGSVLYKYLIAPLFMIFAYITMTIPLVIGWLLKKLKMEQPPSLTQEIQIVMGDENMLDELAESTEISPDWIGTVVTILVILFFLFICYVIVRKIVENAGGSHISDVAMTRTATDAQMPDKKRRRIFRSTPADTVRACYRKYLDICRELMIPVDGSIASDRIADRSEGHTGKDVTRALRSLWLPARYAEDASTEEDARQAKLLLKDIKKNVK